MSNIICFPRERLVQCCRELCHRCELGHEPWPDEDLELNHGTDQVGEQYVGPERCDATPIWRMILAAEGDTIHCEHGVAYGEYCEVCNKEYKRAAREAGYED